MTITMTNKEILKIAVTQSAIDLGASESCNPVALRSVGV